MARTFLGMLCESPKEKTAFLSCLRLLPKNAKVSEEEERGGGGKKKKKKKERKEGRKKGQKERKEKGEENKKDRQTGRQAGRKNKFFKILQGKGRKGKKTGNYWQQSKEERR